MSKTLKIAGHLTTMALGFVLGKKIVPSSMSNSDDTSSSHDLEYSLAMVRLGKSLIKDPTYKMYGSIALQYSYFLYTEELSPDISNLKSLFVLEHLSRNTIDDSYRRPVAYLYYRKSNLQDLVNSLETLFKETRGDSGMLNMPEELKLEILNYQF